MNKEVMGVQEVSPGYEFVAENPAVPVGYKQTEVGVIPEDWGISSVGDEFTIQLGKMLDSERNTGEPKPYIGNRAVQWGRIDTTDLATVPMTKADLNKYRLDEGDILVCEGGEVGRAAIWNAQINECYFQKALHRLKPISGYNNKLMVAILRRWADKGILKNYVTQTSIAHLPRDKFLTIPIPVPPAEEQRAIATALSDVDALLEELDRLIAKKRDIKQAAMQQLLTGETRLPGFEEEWEIRTLSSISDIRSGGTPSTSDSRLWNGGIPWCTPTDITFLKSKYLLKTERTISRQGLQSSSAELIPAGSTIMTSRATIGECAINRVPMATNQGFKNLIPTAVDNEFLYYMMTMQKDRLISLCTGSTFLEIGKKQLDGYELFIPSSMEEQAAISLIVSDMDTEIQALEQRRSKTAELKQGMMQELLTGRTRLV
jgi:type I restriction enzyme S subunit